MRFSPWSISQQSQSGNFHPKHNIWRTENPVNPRKMDPILQVRSFTVKTCQFPICTVTVWIKIGQKQIVSFKHVRLHLLKYGKFRLKKSLPQKPTYPDPLKNAGKGRQAFPFEMVPFQLTYPFSGRDTLYVYTPEN